MAAPHPLPSLSSVTSHWPYLHRGNGRQTLQMRARPRWRPGPYCLPATAPMPLLWALRTAGLPPRPVRPTVEKYACFMHVGRGEPRDRQRTVGAGTRGRGFWEIRPPCAAPGPFEGRQEAGKAARASHRMLPWCPQEPLRPSAPVPAPQPTLRLRLRQPTERAQSGHCVPSLRQLARGEGWLCPALSAENKR